MTPELGRAIYSLCEKSLKRSNDFSGLMRAALTSKKKGQIIQIPLAAPAETKKHTHKETAP